MGENRTENVQAINCHRDLLSNSLEFQVKLRAETILYSSVIFGLLPPDMIEILSKRTCYLLIYLTTIFFYATFEYTP